MAIANLATIFVLTFVTALLGQVESKATFGIGMRIDGDQLLVKDVLQARSNGVDETATISFNYAVPEPITAIEIMSEENVLAVVNFSYDLNLVSGSVTATLETTMIPRIHQQPFEVLITIYGFNETISNPNVIGILNRSQTFNGYLEPQQNDEDMEEYDFPYVNDDEHYDNTTSYITEEHYGNISSYIAEQHYANITSYVAEFDDVESDEEEENEGMDFDAPDEDFEHTDKTIEVGQRQNGDYLIYDTVQTSSSGTDELTNHTVIFYYIDSNFITYAKFVIYDHYIDKPMDDDYIPPMAEYTHYSPNTLKATITDHKTTSLFVQMLLYGYRPADLPVAYAAFLKNSLRSNGNGATEAPLSPLQRLQKLMKQQGGGSNSNESAEEKRRSSSAEVDTGADTAATNNVACLERAVAVANEATSGAAAASMSVSFLSILTRCLPAVAASGASLWTAAVISSLWVVGGAVTGRRHV